MQPCFWNKVEIEDPKNRFTYCEDKVRTVDLSRTMAILDFFLDTTRGAPFSFTLSDSWPVQSAYVRPVLLKLLHHSMQWKDISMQLRHSEFALLRNVKDCLPLLRSLDLMLLDNAEMDDITVVSELRDMFKYPPLLRRIELIDFRFSNTVLRFNWALLTSIQLYEVDDPEEILSFLRQTINLKELSMAGQVKPGSVSINSGILELPFLEYLALDGIPLLIVLKTPALKRLVVAYPCYSKKDDINEAGITIDFLLRSNCDLLTFSSEALEWPALQKVLSYMPGLEELSLVYDEIPIRRVRWLAGLQPMTDAIQTCYGLPLIHLTKLSFYTYSGIREKELKAVERMIARRSQVTELKELVIESRVGWSEESEGSEGSEESEESESEESEASEESEDQSEIGSSDVLDDLESLCEDEGVLFTFELFVERPDYIG